jgi:hypothetical protein
MTFRFRLHGSKLRHTWEKECRREAALVHAEQVARECAKDKVYEGTAIRVTDPDGNEVATVAISE